jgi:SAM-dependent methyltransferase
VQIIADAAVKPFDELRIIDLGCLEGLHSIELASRGAAVLGVEGRQANVAKAEFSRRVLSLDSLEFRQDDVRDVTKERYGEFDVVLCMGILYHLDTPDLFAFLEHVADICNGIAIVDTQFTYTGDQTRTYKGRQYYGTLFTEHASEAPTEQRLAKGWASLDNANSFWLTRPSLFNVLAHVGFTTVFECNIPTEVNKLDDRTTLLAFRGERQLLHAFPAANELPWEDWPEKRRPNLSVLQLQRQRQRWPYRFARTLLPPALRKAIRRQSARWLRPRGNR